MLSIYPQREKGEPNLHATFHNYLHLKDHLGCFVTLDCANLRQGYELYTIAVMTFGSVYSRITTPLP